MTASTAVALIQSRLDYSNSVCYDICWQSWILPSCNAFRTSLRVLPIAE